MKDSGKIDVWGRAGFLWRWGGVAVSVTMVAGCGASTGNGANTSTTSAELAAATSGVTTGSTISTTPELGGLMAGLMPPRLPDGAEVFRCDPAPAITTATVCGRIFPATIELQWTDCLARPPHGGDGRDPETRGDGGASDAGGANEGRSAGKVSITNAVTAEPAGTCGATAVITVSRTSNGDITTTEADGTSEETVTATSSLSTRDPAAKEFSQTKTYDIARTDRDASGATSKSTRLTGQVSETFDDSGASPLRTLTGTLDHDHGDGTTSAFKMMDVVFPAPGDCRWPTAGIITETRSDGVTHTLVFGATCGQATLDGTSIILPVGGIHLGGTAENEPGHAGDHGQAPSTPAVSRHR
ncbi:MAG TPA: hypothetical protein VGL59_03015 [Polyangia bacterium]|jgi:hypothetical protein